MTPPPEPTRNFRIPKFLNTLTHIGHLKRAKSDMQITHLPLPEHEKAQQLALLQEQARARGRELGLIYLDTIDTEQGRVARPAPVRMTTPDRNPALTRVNDIQQGRESRSRAHTPTQEYDDDEAVDQTPASSEAFSSPKRQRIENWISSLSPIPPSFSQSMKHTISRKPVPAKHEPVSPTGTELLPFSVLKPASPPSKPVRSLARPFPKYRPDYTNSWPRRGIDLPPSELRREPQPLE